MKNKIPLRIICLLAAPAYCLLLAAQTYNSSPDMGNLKGSLQDKLKKPFSIGGGASLSSVFTDNGGPGTVNDQPFTWIASGNLNLTVLGTALPFSFNFSNKKVQYTNPSLKFNRFSLHPKYKEWTAHIGDISTTLSPYTLSGMQYTGGGIEYNKGKWQAQALVGRFQKAVREDTLTTPAYKRMGWGGKVAFNSGNTKFAFSLFHAKDNPGSIPQPVRTANAGITPSEGTSFALEGSYPILKGLTVSMEYSTSILTRDLRVTSDSTGAGSSFFKKLAGTANGSTMVYHALKTGFNYTFRQSGLGVSYERVDPGYQTPGGYFFTNDFENITLNLSQTLWKGKATLSANAGLQHDDLNNTKQNGMQRLVASGNLNIRPSQKATITLTYSNMQSYTYVRTGFEQINQVTPYQNLDTLNFTQLSQNACLSVNYTLKQSKEQAQTLTASCNLMETAKKTGDIIRSGDATRLVNGSVSHVLTLPQKSFSVSSSLTASYNYAATLSSYTWGPSVNLSKVFFKKILNTTCGLAYNASVAGGKSIGIMNVRAGASATLAKKHNLNMNMVWQNKSGGGMPAVTCFTATAAYGYSF
jgi:hypothetical protein